MRARENVKEPLLTRGEWEAVLFQCPDQIKPLIVKLAVYHGHLTDSAACPECGRMKAETGKQETEKTRRC
jgi:hypothetical protein